MHSSKFHIGPFQPDLPIVQGGMGVGISLSGLASAVAEAGGIGIISTVAAGMMEPDGRTNFREANLRALRRELRRARRLTDGVIGLNIMVALTDYQDLVDCAVDEEADILFLGAGLPLRFSPRLPPERLRTVRSRFVPIVSSDRAVHLIFRHWAKKFGRVPDAVVVEGPLAGGHLGFGREQINDPAFALENLVPKVKAAASAYEEFHGEEIPVIAAGGIFSGGDIRKFLEMGAAGVQLGTRFVATHECDADIRFKQAYLNASREDLVIIDSPVGMPGRAVRNRFLDEMTAGGRRPFRCSWKCLKSCRFQTAPYCIAAALDRARTGEMEDGFAFAGANAHRVDRIMPVRELIASLRREFRAAAPLRPAPRPAAA